MYETALVSFCSARENHEGGEYDIMILAAAHAEFLFALDTAQAELWSFRAA